MGMRGKKGKNPNRTEMETALTQRRHFSPCTKHNNFHDAYSVLNTDLSAFLRKG